MYVLEICFQFMRHENDISTAIFKGPIPIGNLKILLLKNDYMNFKNRW